MASWADPGVVHRVPVNPTPTHTLLTHATVYLLLSIPVVIIIAHNNTSYSYPDFLSNKPNFL
jgi:hypothetical protein